VAPGDGPRHAHLQLSRLLGYAAMPATVGVAAASDQWIPILAVGGGVYVLVWLKEMYRQQASFRLARELGTDGALREMQVNSDGTVMIRCEGKQRSRSARVTTSRKDNAPPITDLG
jgi:hypothetical protein